MTSSNIGNIVFSQPKASGNFKKIGISDPNGKKVLIETEECFSWEVQKNDRYDSHSMPLAFKNSDQTVKTLREILQKCKDHLQGHCQMLVRETRTRYNDHLPETDILQRKVQHKHLRGRYRD